MPSTQCDREFQNHFFHFRRCQASQFDSAQIEGANFVDADFTLFFEFVSAFDAHPDGASGEVGRQGQICRERFFILCQIDLVFDLFSDFFIK